MFELVDGMWGAMGDLFDVSDEARPSAENVQKMAHALVMTSQYYDFLHPKYVCLFMLAQSAVRCAKPIAQEAFFNKTPKKSEGKHEFVDKNKKPVVDAETKPPAEPPPVSDAATDAPLDAQLVDRPAVQSEV